ncbi:Uncharacterised protein [uncultured archaeon]|nr:Uncharacterised protein [uncultured archaeon]
MERHTNKPVTVMFADKKIHSAYLKLKDSTRSEDKVLFQQIEQALDDLKKNPFCGIEIPKKLIPAEYVRRFGVNNLWKIDLRNGWRIIYTNVSDEVKILSVVLEWFDHSDYEKRFGY